jgi:molybdate transport system substrate-binding protein
MKIRSLRIIAVPVASVVSYLLLAASASGVLNAAEIKVLSGAVTKPVMNEIIPQFERSSGHKVTIDYAPTGPVIVNRIQKGEAVDVAIASQQAIADLEKQGRIAGGSPVDIAKNGVGVFVRKGAPKPDISSVEAFKRALLAAKSIAHADPARGGRTGVYVASLLDQLDIAAGIKSKITIFPPGVFDTIAKGDVEIGIGGISEIITDPRVELVGPLPAAIQNYNQFTAGIVASSKEQDAGQALIQYLTSPAAAAVWKAKGYERTK